MAAESTDSAQRVSGARHRPVFSTRSANADDSRLAPSDLSPDSTRRFQLPVSSTNPYEPVTSASRPSPRRHARTNTLLDGLSRWWHGPVYHQDEAFRREMSLEQANAGDTSLEIETDRKKDRGRHRSRTGSNGTSEKLGTFSGVFVPTTLNVLSILMFIRFGFILGQGGVLGMMGMIYDLSSYTILMG